MWGKSIQGRGSACAKTPKRESGAPGNLRQLGPGASAEWAAGTGARGGPLVMAALGESSQTQQWADVPTPGA